MRLWTIPILALLFLGGCGSSSEKTSQVESNNTININQEENQTDISRQTETNNSTEITKTKGYLIDSPISGANYICADGTRGITDATGMFECHTAPVTFTIGGLILGTIESFTQDGKVYPQDLLGLERNNFSDSRLKLLTRFLQALDDDGDIDESITITSSVRESFQRDSNFADLSEESIANILQDSHREMPPECIALRHLGADHLECTPNGEYASQGGTTTPPNNPPTQPPLPQNNTPEVEAKLSANSMLVENRLNNQWIMLSLIHGLHFGTENLLNENFALISDLSGLTISNVVWIDSTHAKLQLSFDGHDITQNHTIQVNLDHTIIDQESNITTNLLSVKEEIDSFYEDINITLNLHQTKNIDFGIEANQNLSLVQDGSEGSSQVFTIANEFWGMQYAHQSCNLYDRVVYQTTQKGKGVVNINIFSPIPSILDQNLSLYLDDQLKHYHLISDQNISSIEVSHAEHGTASIVHHDGIYSLNYQPNSGFLGREDLKLSINGIIDGCSFNTQSTITINVSMKPDYAMVSFYNDQNQCVPFVSDGTINNTLPLENIQLADYKCDGGLNPISYDYVKLNDHFIFDTNSNTQLHRVNATNRDHSLLNSNGEFSQLFLETTFIAKYHNYNTQAIFSAFKQSPQEWNEEASLGAGRLPWAVKRDGDLKLLDDFVMGVSGDETISNYTQGYQAYLSFLSGYPIYTNNTDLYSVGFDNTNGNGLSLNKTCIFEDLMSCSNAEHILLSEVNQTEGLRSSTNFSIGINLFNDLFYFDNTNKNLWITIGKELTYANGSDKTRLVSHQEYSKMELNARKKSSRVYFHATKNSGEREIGYFYHSTPTILRIINGITENPTPQRREELEIDHVFNLIGKERIIDLGVSDGKWIVAGDKIYASIRGATGSTLYEVTDGRLKSLTADPNDATIQACALAGGCNGFIKDLKYIDGYLYVLKVNSNNKNILAVIDTTDNTTHLIGASMDKNIALYPNTIHPNNLNYYKIFYTTKEESGNTYIYKLYGYNSYKKESTLLKTQTVPAP